jgi:hypothetical protein
MTFRSISRSRVSLACLVIASVSLALTACGGGSDPDEVSRADTKAARTARGQAAHEAARGQAAATRAVQPQAITPWVPKVTDTWQWQLTGNINTSYNVTVYDIDLFDAPDSVLTTLRNQGKRIVCYFSAGSSEDWRPDYNQFKAADKGNTLDGWAGERWLDTRSTNVRNIMKARLDKAKARGCDGVEPDNVDGYTNNPGFPLTANTQLDYNRFLATEAHARGLKIALKNDVDQLSALAPSFDFAVNEQCNQYSECGGYTVFTNNGKPVFNAEYKKIWRTDANARAQMCAKAKAMNLRTLVLPLNLNDAFRYSCD